MNTSSDKINHSNSLNINDENIVKKEQLIENKNINDPTINSEPSEKLKSGVLDTDKKILPTFGRKHRGKAYLLKKIMESNNFEKMNSFSVETQGISCDFLELEDNGNIFPEKDNLSQQVIQEKEKKKE